MRTGRQRLLLVAGPCHDSRPMSATHHCTVTHSRNVPCCHVFLPSLVHSARRIVRLLAGCLFHNLCMQCDFLAQDVACPYMLDGRHAADTLFLVAEADMRFYRRDEIPAQTWLEAAGQETVFDSAAVSALRAQWRHDPVPSKAAPLMTARSSSHPSLSPGPTQHNRMAASSSASSSWQATPACGHGAVRGVVPPRGSARSSLSPTPQPPENEWPRTQMAEASAGQRRAFGAWDAGQRTQLPDASLVQTRELVDLVHIATQAHRRQVGNMIWYTWCGGNRGRKAAPGHGSMLLGFTRTAAFQFHAELLSQRPAHADVVLRNACQEGRITNCCFVWPAVGSFATHESGVERMRRPSEWEKTYVQEGVRPGPGDRDRYLAKFTTHGSPDWVGPRLEFGSEGNVWRTRRPPDIPEAPAEPWHTILVARGWLTPAGEWLGPSKGAGKGRGPERRRQGRQHGRAEPFAGRRPTHRPAYWSEYDLLREDPDMRIDMHGRTQNISALAAELVTDYPDFAWGGGWSQRVWNQRRRAIMLYKHRVFTDRDEEAAPHMCRTSERMRVQRTPGSRTHDAESPNAFAVRAGGWRMRSCERGVTAVGMRGHAAKGGSTHALTLCGIAEHTCGTLREGLALHTLRVCTEEASMC